VESVGWRDTLGDAAEPTPEEMAPFELEAPAAETIPPAAETPPAEPYGVGIFDLPAPPARPEPLEIEETPEETFAKFSRDIASLKDLSPENADKLRRLGITVPLLLLKRGATAEGRRQISADADIPEDQIYRWVRYIDLFRIKGVGQEYAELLESAGVETVAALGRSDPDALYARLRQIADPQRLPASQVVAAWVAQAKKLPRSVTD
jgi:predicted flap endonuclease-1-like 5' DNA nuclease